LTELTFIAAFMTGLLGSVHCIGMCGGIVGALTFQLPDSVRQRPQHLLPYLLSYNLGRISSYTLAGLLAGFLGSQFIGWLPDAHLIGRLISGVFMIALGLYLGAWWRGGLHWLERLGTWLWRRIEPLGRRFFPVTSPWQALGLGLVWGWLPCGLVYTALALALAAASTLEGGLLLLAFGLGTLPMLLAMGSTAHWLIRLTRHPWFRHSVAALMIAFGLYTLLVANPHTAHALQLPGFCATPTP